MTLSRRSALKGMAIAAAGPLVLPHGLLFGQATPANRIRVGFIGLGVHGFGYNLPNFLNQDDAVATAVCDVFESRRSRGKERVDKKYGNADCKSYAKFDDLLADPSVDAVCISTPDHWHVPMALRALRAGKDVMCEKPTLTIEQGQRLVSEFAKAGKVFQMGIEDRSLVEYHKVAELVRNGAIGELKKIHVGLPSGKAYPMEQPEDPPAELDWDLWLGPAPEAPYTKSKTLPMVWRNIRDYSGGILADWGAHLLDTAQVANFAEKSAPVEVEGTGKYPEPGTSLSTMPMEWKINYRYGNGVEMTCVSGGVELRFEGTTGWVGNKDWRGRLQASDDKILRMSFPPESNRMWKRPPGEHRDFLDCVKSRKPAAATYTPEMGHRLSTVMHIGNIAIELKRKLRWDPAAESFGDAAADALKTRPARGNWI